MPRVAPEPGTAHLFTPGIARFESLELGVRNSLPDQSDTPENQSAVFQRMKADLPIGGDEENGKHQDPYQDRLREEKEEKGLREVGTPFFSQNRVARIFFG